jgi:putative glycosyltransferase
LIGGILLFFDGVIAIYVGTIFLEVKQRPRTIVRRIMRFDA